MQLRLFRGSGLRMRGGLLERKLQTDFPGVSAPIHMRLRHMTIGRIFGGVCHEIDLPIDPIQTPID